MLPMTTIGLLLLVPNVLCKLSELVEVGEIGHSVWTVILYVASSGFIADGMTLQPVSLASVNISCSGISGRKRFPFDWDSCYLHQVRFSNSGSVIMTFDVHLRFSLKELIFNSISLRSLRCPGSIVTVIAWDLPKNDAMALLVSVPALIIAVAVLRRSRTLFAGT
ncbi:hypothetical protein AYI68_g7415 [Smittium mucronatum]|uniref:Uncharacterized protein n=1 Tax=Smittium mucronatum TaxID=133383 RepID=A0A1R0GNR7_9FUNG|nr:hypothetical protein AYI68_g7415 [Smittium mucronatum]